MPCCPSSCHESCPETTPVTIIQTNLVFDGSNFYAHQERFSRSAGTVVSASGRYVLMTLAYSPVSPSFVNVYANSAAMRPGVDYVVSGKQVYLVNEAAIDSEYLVKYSSIEGAAASVGAGTTWDTGDLQPFFTDPGTGWLPMLSLADGGIAHEKAAYTALGNYLALNRDLLVGESYGDGPTFQLKSLTSPVYVGSAIQQLRVYIKV